MGPPPSALFTGLHKDITLSNVEKDSEEWLMVKKHFQTTQGQIHRISEELVEILKITTPESANFNFPGEKLILWQGTTRHDVSKILNKRILINSAPKRRNSGRIFEQGVQLADSMKNYETDNYVFLCEVFLGKTFFEFNSIKQHLNDLIVNSGYDSVKGVGKSCASENSSKERLHFNEYIIYDERRITFKYLLKFQKRKFSCAF